MQIQLYDRLIILSPFNDASDIVIKQKFSIIILFILLFQHKLRILR